MFRRWYWAENERRKIYAGKVDDSSSKKRVGIGALNLINNMEVISDKGYFQGKLEAKARLDWIQERKRGDDLDTTSINISEEFCYEQCKRKLERDVEVGTMKRAGSPDDPGSKNEM